MAGYAKLWTDIFNDEWFVSLTGIQRSIWLQLIIYVKWAGDNSRIFVRTMQQLGEIFGCDGRSVRKSVALFDKDGKINLRESKKGIEIIMLNYEYWQRDRKIGQETKKGKSAAKVQQKCSTKLTRAELPEHIYSPAKNSQDIASDKIPYQEIIEDLNRKAKTAYKHTSAKTRELIKARWNEGWRLGDFKKVHKVKAEEWLNDPEWGKYLRPSTLYRIGKFEDYVNQSIKPEKQESPEVIRMRNIRRDMDKQRKARGDME